MVTEPRPGAVVVEISGDHDLVTQPELDELLTDLIGGHELVVVDISSATFIDSSFIHGLQLANEATALRGGTFRLMIATGAIVKRTIEVTRINEQIEVVSTREEALGSSAPPALASAPAR